MSQSDDQNPTPPYEGRRESADVDSDPDVAVKEGAKVGGATGPVEGVPPAENAERNGSEAGVSPADEQPAQEQPEGTSPVPTDEGVGPAHIPGVPKGEDSGA